MIVGFIRNALCPTNFSLSLQLESNSNDKLKFVGQQKKVSRKEYDWPLDYEKYSRHKTFPASVALTSSRAVGVIVQSHLP
jgi:hypothetical protein